MIKTVRGSLSASHSKPFGVNKGRLTDEEASKLNHRRGTPRSADHSASFASPFGTMALESLPDPNSSSSEAQKKKMEEAAKLQREEVDRQKKKQEAAEKARLEQETQQRQEAEKARRAEEEQKKREEQERDRTIKEQKGKEKALKEQQKANLQQMIDEHNKTAKLKQELAQSALRYMETSREKGLATLNQLHSQDQLGKAVFWDRYNEQARYSNPSDLQPQDLNKSLLFSSAVPQELLVSLVASQLDSSAANAPPHQLTPQEEKGDSAVQPNLKAFLSMLNEFRANPKKYAEYLENRFIDKIDSEGAHLPSGKVFIEGKGVFYDAQSALASQKQLNTLEVDAGLCAAAFLRAKRQAELNKLSPVDDAEAEKLALRWVTKGTGIGVSELSLQINELNLQDVICILYANDGDFVRSQRQSLSKDGFWNVGFGVFQKNKFGPIFCTIYLSGEGYKGEASKIPKSLMVKSGMEQYLKSK